MLVVAARSSVCSILLALLLLGPLGCTTNSSAVYATIRGAIAGEADITESQLRPGVQYLRMRLGARSVYLALGFLESDVNGQRQIWYSGGGEVLKTQNGRIVGSAGLQTDWRMVRQAPPPGWRDMPAIGVTYERVLDVMPGYRMGIREKVRIRPIAPVLDSRLAEFNPAALSWFEETVVSTSVPFPSPTLPAALFAVDLSQNDAPVIFSRQCLAPDLCFSLQPWPPRPAAK